MGLYCVRRGTSGKGLGGLIAPKPCGFLNVPDKGISLWKAMNFPRSGGRSTGKWRMREIRPSGDRRKGPLLNSGAAFRRQPRSRLLMSCHRLKGGGDAFALLHLGLTSRFRGERLPIGSLLLQPSGGTHPQRHSILEVLRRSESVRWFLPRRCQSCSSRKQWLDLFQNRQQPAINSSIFHRWTLTEKLGSGGVWGEKQWILRLGNTSHWRTWVDQKRFSAFCFAELGAAIAKRVRPSRQTQ
jgi:hypothetical protein